MLLALAIGACIWGDRFLAYRTSPVGEVWPALTALEHSRLFVSVRRLEKGAIQVVCLRISCRDLATSYIQVFERCGWVILHAPESLEEAETVGVLVLSGSELDRQISDAIRKTRSVDVRFVLRSRGPAETVVLVIGTMPNSFEG